MRRTLGTLLLLPAVAAGVQCGNPFVFLVDADLDDDGVVDADDVARVTGCLGAAVPDPEIEFDVGGCPVVVGPPPGACDDADLDGDGAVDTTDLAHVELRLGIPVCNGSEALCARRFDEVAYATTHNAMAARFPPYEYSILVSNQCEGPQTQLDDGVRGFMLDFHWFQPPGEPAPDLYLCHSECGFGHQLLVEGLAEFRAWLDAHPAEVIAFIVETNAGTSGREAEIRDAFAASGLIDRVHTQPAGAPWPTLGEMIASGRRLVVLTDDSSNAGCGAEACPWYHYLWSAFAFETPFSNATPQDFTCSDLRGQPGNDLFILNHFLTQQVGAPQFAQQVNHNPLLGARAQECWDFQGRIPNFVTVDFYEIGDVVRVVDWLNFAYGATAAGSPD